MTLATISGGIPLGIPLSGRLSGRLSHAKSQAFARQHRKSSVETSADSIYLAASGTP